MNKKSLSERDIYAKFINLALQKEIYCKPNISVTIIKDNDMKRVER